MTTDQFLNTVKQIIGSIIVWVKLAASLVLAGVVLATLLVMAGYPIPYVPAIKGSIQEIAIFTACIAYRLK